MPTLLRACLIITLGFMGGILFTKITGLSFGWLIGSIVIIGDYQLLTASSLKLSCVGYAKNIGQLFIGVNIGQQFNSLNVDVPFVVTVQTLRLVMVVFTLPFLIKLIMKMVKGAFDERKNNKLVPGTLW